MGTRVCLGLACVALVAALSGCGSSNQSADQISPDTSMINASAALVEPTSGADATSADAAETCQVAKAAFLIGRRDSAAARAALTREIGRASVRWIRPGDVIIQDVRRDRLNIMVGEDGIVETVRCG